MNLQNMSLYDCGLVDNLLQNIYNKREEEEKLGEAIEHINEKKERVSFWLVIDGYPASDAMVEIPFGVARKYFADRYDEVSSDCDRLEEILDEVNKIIAEKNEME